MLRWGVIGAQFLISLNMHVCLQVLASDHLNPVDQVCDAHNQLTAGTTLRFAFHFSMGKPGRTGVRKWLSVWNACHEDLNMLSPEPQPKKTQAWQHAFLTLVPGRQTWEDP